MDRYDAAFLEEQIQQYSRQLLAAAGAANAELARAIAPPAPPIPPAPATTPPPMPVTPPPPQPVMPPQPIAPPRQPEPPTPPAGLTPQEEFLLFSQANPQRGAVRVQTFTARDTYPVSDVQVVISKVFDSGEYIITTDRTDSAGLTSGVSLPAPDRALSEHPGNAKKPYADYQAVLTHPEFTTVHITRLPVFPGVTALQRVNLIPRAAAPNGGAPIEYAATEPSDL